MKSMVIELFFFDSSGNIYRDTRSKVTTINPQLIIRSLRWILVNFKKKRQEIRASKQGYCSEGGVKQSDVLFPCIEKHRTIP